MSTVLFVHQNFPGQFKHLAPVLVERGHSVISLGMRPRQIENEAIQHHQYTTARGTTAAIHPWVSDFETKVIRAEACFNHALTLKQNGLDPDLIFAHPGWGESLFLKEVWPRAKLLLYCEFFYLKHGADFGFDPEFPVKQTGDYCRLQLKNINNLVHFEQADAGMSPTQWQASTFPKRFRDKIEVIHDGIDTQRLGPNSQVTLRLSNGITLRKKDKVVTFVNRNLEPYRGFHIFMRALPSILRQDKDCYVLIVGGDEVSYGAKPEGAQHWREVLTEEINQEIDPEDWKRVFFLGNIPYNHFVALLQVSMVHAYLTYPFVLSWSLLEAMSAGCCIVASNTAPVQEVIKHGETGQLVDFFDASALAAEVLAALSSPALRSRLGAAARQLVRENFDLHTVCLPRQIALVERLCAV